MTRSVLVICLALGATSCSITVVADGTLRHVEAPSRAALDPDRVEVLVWNVYKSSRPTWWRDFQRLVQQHDVQLLQEGWWNAELEQRYRGLGCDWWMGVTFVSGWEAAESATGTIVGSKAVVFGVASRHSPHVEPLLGTPKSHTLGRMELEGRHEELLAVSVHGINFRLDESAFATQLALLFRDISGHSGPAIVAGDFNTWNAWRTAHLFAAMDGHGFRSVYPRSPQDAPDDGRASVSGHYLDHAFVQGLDVSGEPVVLDTVHSSDHQALSFVVRVPDRRHGGDRRGHVGRTKNQRHGTTGGGQSPP